MLKKAGKTQPFLLYYRYNFYLFLEPYVEYGQL